jgi:spore maturation protein CgeB
VKILYSFNKRGAEGEQWATEIAAASESSLTLVPFNHQNYLDPLLYCDATKLDRLYREKHPGLLKLYSDLVSRMRIEQIDVLLVANCPPYHPDFLRTLSVYKVLYSADDPGATYLINIPYLHAYHHVLFVDPAYSRDMDMVEKMRYAGMTNADFLPISVFDFEHAAAKSAEEIFLQPRDIPIIYVGSFWRQKIPLLMSVAQAFGSSFKVYGFFRLKHNLYLNIIHGSRRWIRPISLQQRVALYQRAKIGINIHWDEYGLGNQRLYHLPANGVMQISDCDTHLGRIFKIDKEIVGYRTASDLIDKIHYYLSHEDARIRIARGGYARAMLDYRFATVTRRAARLIKAGMQRVGWPSQSSNRYKGGY